MADASRLRTTYALQEAKILDESGRLTEAAIENSRRAISKNSVINNDSVVQTLTRDGSKITDWTKKTTESIPLLNGQRIQVHYYQNTVTGKIDYIHSDFKIKGIVNDTKKDLGSKSPWLTVGNEYIILAMNVSSKNGVEIYIQLEHYKEPFFVDLDGFEMISQSIPTSWVTIIEQREDQTLISMLPKSWSTNKRFFEDLEDEKAEAVALFNKEAELIYKEEV